MRRSFLVLIVSLRKIVRGTRRVLIGSVGSSYKPEKHFMRGPGPKHAAKYGHLVDNIR